MQAHADTYQPYLVDAVSVDQFCNSQIEPFQVEIDHLGLKALIDVLVNPARIAVEILYLDRSDVTEANTHRFEPMATSSPVDAAGSSYWRTPSMYLLYRP
jgi:ubiquitin thioesterase protein OTUB1